MRALFAGFTTRGKSFLAAGIAAGAFGLGLGERDLLSIGIVLVALPLLAALATSRARYRIRCTRRISPPRVPAGQSATGHAAAGERLPAAHRPAAGRGHAALLARHPAALRAGTDRAGRLAGAELPDRVRDPGQVHDRPAPGAGGGRVRPGRADPVVRLPEHAGGHAAGHPAAAPAAGRQLAWRGRRRPDPDRGHGRRGRRHPPAVPGRRRAAPGALAVHRAVRRADGPARGTALAQPRGAAARHPRPGAQRRRGGLLVRVRGQRRPRPSACTWPAAGSTGSWSPTPGPVQRPGLVRGHAARLAGRDQAVRGSATWPAAGPRVTGGTGGLFVVVAGRLSARGGPAGWPPAAGTPARRMALLLAVSTWAAARAAARPGPAEVDVAAGILRAAGWRVTTLTADTPLAGGLGPAAVRVRAARHADRGRPRPAGVGR